MNHTLKIEKNKAIFTLNIPTETVEKAMQSAATELSKNMKIPGFRPGKAPYETIKRQVGEMQLLEHAAEGLIRSAFSKALMEENLDTVGQPFFDAEKFAPGNDLIIKAEIAIFPKVTKLADYKNIKIEAANIEPTNEQLDEAKRDLARMQMSEKPADKNAQIAKGDKVVLNLTMKKNGVVLEGGEGQAHGVYTNEPHYIDGFVDKILGHKIGDELTFTLSFPENHYQKHLAGQPVDFEIKINEIFNVELPEINDDFAKKIGLKDLKDLEEKLHNNLRHEREHEEQLRKERELIDQIIDGSTFEEIPDLLVNQEINKMIEELERQIQEQGMDFNEYLKQIKKTISELKLDFTPTAIKRIKASIVVKKIAEIEKIEPTEDQLDKALDELAQKYPDEKSKEIIYSPGYREMLSGQMKNKLVIDSLLIN
jgi:trigger factor